MAKVFTITEGLENLGALKSGGQGSVYKGRRDNDIITAIKILPTPIYSETGEDKNFLSFQNEVQKLKKVNEVHNPNVVRIIGSGLTSSGNLPYIEMEYIEGPDLGELLKSPYDPIFTIKKAIKVADHLANALAHCHRANVKHGDIKSNNIKFNKPTGNYILLDFGLSIMSDEQRRTSIRYAGAIEFMAPEQNLGTMLFETDIYSFGIILFELLAGTVPFPLNSKGEIARNSVMLAHMELQPPDLLSLRSKAMPDSWSAEKKEMEMNVPTWFPAMIYKCLEKDPEKRFRNGEDLQEFIHYSLFAKEDERITDTSSTQPLLIGVDESKLKNEIHKLELQITERDELIKDLHYQVETKDKELYHYHYMEQHNTPRSKGISKALFFFVLIITFGLAGFTAYNKFMLPGNKKDIPIDTTTQSQVNQRPGKALDTVSIHANKPIKKVKSRIKKTSSTIGK
ncbi:MAG: serine/threonine-protein kinase [Ferruginibacter sp.]